MAQVDDVEELVLTPPPPQAARANSPGAYSLDSFEMDDTNVGTPSSASNSASKKARPNPPPRHQSQTKSGGVTPTAAGRPESISPMISTGRSHNSSRRVGTPGVGMTPLSPSFDDGEDLDASQGAGLTLPQRPTTREGRLDVPGAATATDGGGSSSRRVSRTSSAAVLLEERDDLVHLLPFKSTTVTLPSTHPSGSNTGKVRGGDGLGGTFGSTAAPSFYVKTFRDVRNNDASGAQREGSCVLLGVGVQHNGEGSATTTAPSTHTGSSMMATMAPLQYAGRLFAVQRFPLADDDVRIDFGSGVTASGRLAPSAVRLLRHRLNGVGRLAGSRHVLRPVGITTRDGVFYLAQPFVAGGSLLDVAAAEELRAHIAASAASVPRPPPAPPRSKKRRSTAADQLLTAALDVTAGTGRHEKKAKSSSCGTRAPPTRVPELLARLFLRHVLLGLLHLHRHGVAHGAVGLRSIFIDTDSGGRDSGSDWAQPNGPDGVPPGSPLLTGSPEGCGLFATLGNLPEAAVGGKIAAKGKEGGRSSSRSSSSVGDPASTEEAAAGAGDWAVRVDVRSKHDKVGHGTRSSNNAFAADRRTVLSSGGGALGGGPPSGDMAEESLRLPAIPRRDRAASRNSTTPSSVQGETSGHSSGAPAVNGAAMERLFLEDLNAVPLLLERMVRGFNACTETAQQRKRPAVDVGDAFAPNNNDDDTEYDDDSFEEHLSHSGRSDQAPPLAQTGAYTTGVLTTNLSAEGLEFQSFLRRLVAEGAKVNAAESDPLLQLRRPGKKACLGPDSASTTTAAVARLECALAHTYVADERFLRSAIATQIRRQSQVGLAVEALEAHVLTVRRTARTESAPHLLARGGQATTANGRPTAHGASGGGGNTAGASHNRGGGLLLTRGAGAQGAGTSSTGGTSGTVALPPIGGSAHPPAVPGNPFQVGPPTTSSPATARAALAYGRAPTSPVGPMGAPNTARRMHVL